ncbi:DNA polymerase III [Candidatus Woesearchaeota archaeon]|nr:DNA polymerase III [Candidatus Woesearchaeota archaeon]
MGKNIAEKIAEFVEKGKLKYYDELKKKVDIDIEELNAIPGLGPKRIKLLYEKLKIRNLHDLERAIKEHKIEGLVGFGEETVKNLTKGLQVVKQRPQRFLYAQLLPIVKAVLKTLRDSPAVEKAEIAGSFRRGKETIGDLDFLVVSRQPEKVMKIFTSLPDIKQVLAKGTTKSSVVLYNNLQMDLRVVNPKEFGSALLYFIGSKQHNVELRKLCLQQGYTLNEYGLFHLQGKKWAAGKTEEEIYRKVGLQYIEPELRENMGELEASKTKKLPRLPTVKDVQGVFHNHSTWTDGANSLLEMAQRAEELKFKFISFNDHFGTIGITNPLTEKRLGKYLAEIEKVRQKVSLRVFSGVEIDILKDGTLPLPVKKLKELDVVVASIHMALKMPEKEMTKRVCSVLEKYPVNILGHPTDRLLNVREPIALNLDTVFATAKENKVFLEINAQPQRMDLQGEPVKAGKDKGCLFALSTDAHSVDGLSHYPLAVMMARRGWLETKNVLNCWSLPKIEKALQK